MDTSDLIALIMIALAPVFVLIGTAIFFYKHKAEWDAEIAALQKSRKQEKAQKQKRVR